MGSEGHGDACGHLFDLKLGMLGGDGRDAGLRAAPKPGAEWKSSLGKCCAAVCQQRWKLLCESSGMDCTASGSLQASACPSHSVWM